jgi:hypothetical protein
MFIVRFGVRPYGQTHCFAGSAVVTEFFHVWFLPILPRRSLLVDASSGKRLPTSLNTRSVIAAYTGIWGALGAVMTGFTALRRVEASGTWWTWAIACAVCAAASTWSMQRSWRLGSDEEARRTVYAGVSAQPFDVAMLPLYDADLLCTDLRSRVAEHVRRLPGPTYRDVLAQEDEWDRLALAAPDASADFLRDALTLARLEVGLARGAKRARFRRAHDAIWERLRRHGMDASG